MRTLVTGAAQGLGFAMARALDAETYVRGDSFPDGEFDTIVHCAANTMRPVRMADAARYFDDNVGLTDRLLGLPHRRFVYVSSVDVYGRGPGLANDNPAVDHLELYAATKLMSEGLVKWRGQHPLILRPASLLGWERTRRSTIVRLLTEVRPQLYVSADSRFNFVLHHDVCEFVLRCIECGIEGTFNLGSLLPVSLGWVARTLGLEPRWGPYTYDIGRLDVEPAAEILPAFRRTSAETLDLFIDRLPGFVGTGRLMGETV